MLTPILWLLLVVALLTVLWVLVWAVAGTPTADVLVWGVGAGVAIVVARR